MRDNKCIVQLNFCRATLCISAAYTAVQCLAVRLSRPCIKTSKHNILKHIG